jgi:uncharacterized protein (TIGR02147 family)
MIENYEYQETLKSFYQQKSEINKAYSLNAFARDLAMSPSHLSEVLKGKKGISKEAAQRVALKLKLEKEEKKLFINSALSQHDRSFTGRVAARKKLAHKFVDYEISMNFFSIIKDWKHFGVMELIKIKGNDFKKEDALSYFKIDDKTYEQIIKCLKFVKILSGEKKFKVNYKCIHAPIGIPATVKKIHHLGLLKKAQKSYLTQKFEERDYMSNILAINKDCLPEAKKLIKEFHSKMDQLLSEGSKNATDVYCFSTQLFSLKEDKYE